jgi:hypothetical protein
MAVNAKGGAQERSTPQIGAVATSEEVKKGFTLKNPLPPKKMGGPAEPPQAAVAPTYQVYMPPLRYDASQKVQDEPDPKLIVLVRRVRVRPTLIFESRVEGDAPVQSKTLSAAAKPQNDSPVKPESPSNAGLVDRVKNFLKSLWTPSS